jgi:quercetin dioxygenase-like cupin family protein
MNELDKAAQQCWAVAATERFDIGGEIALRIDIAAPPAPASASVVRDTAHSPRLSACLVALMAGYRWAPPLYGQAIQLPFRFRAPDGQNTIDRALVAWNGQGGVSVAVLLDEASTGSAAASMFELAVAAGATTGLRRAERAEHVHAGEAELLYVLAGEGTLTVDGVALPVTATSVVQIPKNTRHAFVATSAFRAVQIFTPAGSERRVEVHP